MAKKIGGKVSIDKLSDALADILDDYAVVTSEDVREAAEKTAAETVRMIQGNAPVKSGAYKSSITAENSYRKRDKGAYVVHAGEDGYRIAHLLEKGHAKAGGGRVGPSPSGGHWAPAEMSAVDTFINLVKEKISK